MNMIKSENINPFKEIENNTQIPPDLKTKVLASVEFGRLLANLAELFTVKIGDTIRELFKLPESLEKQNEKK